MKTLKNILLSLLLAASNAALADFATVNLPADGTPVAAEGRVVIVLSFLDGTTVNRIDEAWEVNEDIVQTPHTNTTYCLTYTNAVGNVATNVTDYDIAPLPQGYQYIDYWTNTVTTYTTETNVTTYLSYAVTNIVAVADTPMDGSDLYSMVIPDTQDETYSYAYLPAGTKLATDGASGSARVMILK